MKNVEKSKKKIQCRCVVCVNCVEPNGGTGISLKKTEELAKKRKGDKRLAPSTYHEAIPNGGFYSISNAPHYFEYYVTMDEITSTMQDFNFDVIYIRIVILIVTWK